MKRVRPNDTESSIPKKSLQERKVDTGNPTLGSMKAKSPRVGMKSPKTTGSPKYRISIRTGSSPRSCIPSPKATDSRSSQAKTPVRNSPRLGTKSPLATGLRSPLTRSPLSQINSPCNRSPRLPLNKVTKQPLAGITSLPLASGIPCRAGKQSPSTKSVQSKSRKGDQIKSRGDVSQSPKQSIVKSDDGKSNTDVESMTMGEFLKMDIVMSSKTGRVKMRSHDHENVQSFHFPSPKYDESTANFEPKVKNLAENYEVKVKENKMIKTSNPRGRAIARGKHVMKERIKTPKRNVDLSSLNEISPTVEVIEESTISDSAFTTADKPSAEPVPEDPIDCNEGKKYDHVLLDVEDGDSNKLNRSIDKLDVDIKSLSKIFDERVSESNVDTPCPTLSKKSSTPGRNIEKSVTSRFKQVENIATPSQILKMSRGGITMRQRNKGRRQAFTFSECKEMEKDNSEQQSAITDPEPEPISVNIKNLRNIFETGKGARLHDDPIPVTPIPKIKLSKPCGSVSSIKSVTSVQSDDLGGKSVEFNEEPLDSEQHADNEDNGYVENEDTFSTSVVQPDYQNNKSQSINEIIENRTEGFEVYIDPPGQKSKSASSVSSRLAEKLSRISENLKMLEDVVYIESPKGTTHVESKLDKSVDVPQLSDTVFETPRSELQSNSKDDTQLKEVIESQSESSKFQHLVLNTSPDRELDFSVKSTEESVSADGLGSGNLHCTYLVEKKSSKHKFSSVDIDPNEDTEESPGKKRCLMKYESTPIVSDKDIRFSVTVEDKSSCSSSWNLGNEYSTQESGICMELEGNLSETAYNNLFTTTNEASKVDRTTNENQHTGHQIIDENQHVSEKKHTEFDLKSREAESQKEFDDVYEYNCQLLGDDCDDNIDALYQQMIEAQTDCDSGIDNNTSQLDRSFDELVEYNLNVLNRYHTQPIEGEDDSSNVRSSRHLTQPITPTEKESAELRQSPDSMSGSIANRISTLQERGEYVKMRNKQHLRSDRPVSLADRMSCLEDSKAHWKKRVEEKDTSKFTVEGRMAEMGGRVAASPLVTKTRGNLQRDQDVSIVNMSSPLKRRTNGENEGKTVDIPEEVVLNGSPATTEQAASTPNIPISTKIVSEDEQTTDSDDPDKENHVVTVPQVDTEEFQSFYTQPTKSQLDNEKFTVDINDLDLIKGHQVLSSTKKARPQQRRAQSSRNPLKALAQRQDIRSEYESHSTGVAERELRRLKKEEIAGKACIATDALAALATKEDFDQVKLRKADTDASTPVTGGARFMPYKDIMLLHVKGRRSCNARLIEPIAASINSGDCFILKTPKKVYVWIGQYCNVIEKSKALDVAQTIQQKHDLGSKSSRSPSIIHENKPIFSDAEEFWNTLDGSHEECQDPGPPEEDELYEMYLSETTMVYRVSGDKLVPVKEYWGQTLKYDMLTEKEAFVFDFGSEVYLWTGKHVAFSDRKVAMKLTTEIWSQGYDYSNCDINPLCPLRTPEAGGLPNKSSSRPSWTLLAKVSQNMETILFKEKFLDWPDSSSTVLALKDVEKDKSVEFVELQACDVKEMLTLDKSPVDLVLEGSHIGRGDKWVETHDGIRREFEICTCDIAVWHVLEYEHYKLDPQSYGQFHDGDTYVIRWRYMVTQSGIKTLKGSEAKHSMTGREKCAYFFWQGRDSSITEKGASALMTVELDEERGPQIRVVQGKEPPCFIQLFSGHMITHIGKREEEETNTQGKWRFYIVRNELQNEAYLLEIPPCVQNLRSRSSFILLNVKYGDVFLWHGAKSSSHTQARGRECAENLKERRALEVGLSENAAISIMEIKEGEETIRFWRGLDGDKTAFHSLLRDSRSYDMTPRLFHLSSVSGTFLAKEIQNPVRCEQTACPFPFLQSDLYKAPQPALFLLSAGRVVYVWQGWWPEATDDGGENVKTGSAENRLSTDRILAMETAVNFCKELNPSRMIRCDLVYAGLEPETFINLFPTWEMLDDVKDIQIKEGRKPGQTISIPEYLEKLTQTKYTYEELQQRPLPEGVDPLNMEKYLHEDQFEEVLQMDKEEFYKLPLWKRNNLKKDKKLF